MRSALMVEYFQELPILPDGDFLAGRSTELQSHLQKFRQRVAGRYLEGTLQRLLSSPSSQARRAALLALGLDGTMASNAAAAACLHDDDAQVRRLAVDVLWNIWFRAEGDSAKRELQKFIRTKDVAKSLRGLTALIEKHPHFAEAYNQRAIVCYRLEEFERSVDDCRQALKLNSYHFGAQSGLAQSFVRLNKPRAALKAFRKALRINPELDGVAELIRELEETLGEEK